MANKTFLDKTGLTYFWSKVKTALSGKQDTLTAGTGISLSNNTLGLAGSAIFYGTCGTAAATAAKVVECASFTSGNLVSGVMVRVKFTNVQNYNGTATLNVNATGAKNITRVGTTTTTRYYWTAGEVVDFVYDGTNWVMSNKGTATTTYYGMTKLATSATSTSTALALTPASLNNLAQDMISGYAAYSTSSTYAVGARVRHGYYIYECKTAITTAEAWTESHWTQLDPLQRQIDDKTSITLSTTDLGEGKTLAENTLYGVYE